MTHQDVDVLRDLLMVAVDSLVQAYRLSENSLAKRRIADSLISLHSNASFIIDSASREEVQAYIGDHLKMVVGSGLVKRSNNG